MPSASENPRVSAVTLIPMLIPIAVAIDWVAGPHGRSLVDLLFRYSLLFGVGVNGIMFWIGHQFRQREVALGVGWEPHPQFQSELAFASLGLGIAGLISVWAGIGFRTATVLIFGVFYLGAAYVRVREQRRRDNRAPLSAGFVLYWDLLFPIVLGALLLATKRGPR